MNKKIVAGSTAIGILFSITANAIVVPTYKTTYELGNNLLYSHIAGIDGNDRQKVNILEYKPNANITPIVVYKEQMYGSKMTITAAENYLEQQGHHVVGGINADFYTLSNGVPSGIVIKDGVLISSDSWKPAIGFKEDGSAVIGAPQINMKLNYASGSSTISYYNKVRTTAGIYLLDENFNTNSLSRSKGTDIVLEQLDNNELTPTSTLTLKVIDIIEGNEPTPLKAGQMVLTIRDEIKDKVPPVQIGEEVTITTNVNNTAWRDVKYAVGANDVLIENGAIKSNLSTKKEPRSVIGVKSDGTVVVYQVDGRQQYHSVGQSLKTVAEEMLALGCVSAINLDGGGSSSIIANLPGYPDVEVMNKPSAGSLRANANYIMFVNNEKPTNVLDKLHIYPENHLMLLGSTIKVDVKGTDEHYYPVAIGGYTVHANEENIQQTFTAKQLGKVLIEVTVDDKTTQKEVTVVDRVDSYTVSVDGKRVESLSLEPNQSVSLNTTATYKLLPVQSSNTSFTYKVIGDIGTIDSQGNFQAGTSKGQGSILISYGSASSKEIPVTIGLPVEDSVTWVFEDEMTFHSESATLSLDTQNVVSGKYSLKAQYQDSATLNIETPINDSEKYLNLKVSATENSNITANFSGQYGNILTVAIDSTKKSQSIIIPEEAVTFTGFSISGGDTIYLDQITLSEVANDHQFPTITNVKNTSTPSQMDVKATITKNNQYALDKQNIQVFLNGKPVEFTYSTFDGQLSVTNKNLMSGLNRLSIYAKDVYGNLSITGLDIQGPSITEEKYQDIKTHWAKNYINFADKKKFVTGEIKDDLYYFNPDRNITRAEFAVIMSRYLGLDTQNTETTVNFVDVDTIPSWALPHIMAVTKAGIMNGSSVNGDLYFNATKPITRAEVITVLGRILTNGFKTTDITFIDNNSIPSWAYNHFVKLNSFGAINGYSDNSIKPMNNITRAEVAKLIYAII